MSFLGDNEQVPRFVGLISVTFSRHDLNLACAALSCANELVKCDSSCRFPEFGHVSNQQTILLSLPYFIELLFDFSELLDIQILNVDRHVWTNSEILCAVLWTVDTDAPTKFSPALRILAV